MKLLIENCGKCPPRSVGWRVSRRRGRILSYLAAYMLGFVLGLVCHIGDSSVARNQLGSSRMPDSLAALVLLVPCTNLLLLCLVPFTILWRNHPRMDRKIVGWHMGQGEDKGGKEIGPKKGAKLVSGDARITNMENKTEHICG